MKVVLCGYHWTGCKALELLLERECEVFVYTHRMENCVADLEGLCKKRNIKYSLEKITVENMPFVPDVICSIYYRYIINKDIIHLVNGKIFNLHPALLPKYRGCSSLTWAMINGEEECGFTYHYIDEGCDTGNIIKQVALKIEPFDTQLTLYNRVMFESMKCFNEVLSLVMAGYSGEVQQGDSSYYKRGCPMNGEIPENINWEGVERFVRAMVYPPYPVARFRGYDIASIGEYELIDKKFSGGGEQ